MTLRVAIDKSVRLFTGISLPLEMIANIEGLVGKLRPYAPAGTRWSQAANLHITTKFIGQWREDRLDELKQALAAVEPRGRIPIRITGFGFLPSVLFAGVDGGDKLPQLADDTNRALEAPGCARETRPYRPHLTLARLKDAKIQSLRTHIQSMPAAEPGTFDASEFHLYLSKPGPGGSVYTKLATWNLA